jgi:hypothetical protein
MAVVSWSYGSWIYNCLCDQCLSPLTLWGRIPIWWGVLDATLCHKVCQWLAPGLWFSPGTPVSYLLSVKEISYQQTDTLVSLLYVQVWHLSLRVSVMVFNATFNNISVISWRSVLLVEETGVPGENHRSGASHWQTSSIMKYIYN